ncbi:hypothetical protein [Mycobacteroides abscessus]|uniref:hypothetical protein n=1 Tax=Mycobacteroides abscessus TaxID=36809 RepID=UPI000D3E390F|nr:hypothetical protein [Mycobacteroides abscessus]PVB33012.1 hypothetical protein DDJ45_10275 [Mycobacteroides abscessus]
MPVDTTLRAQIDQSFIRMTAWTDTQNQIPAPPEIAVFAEDFGRYLDNILKLQGSTIGTVVYSKFDNIADTTNYLVDAVLTFLVRSDIPAEKRIGYRASVEGAVDSVFYRDSVLQDQLVAASSTDIANIMRVALALASLQTVLDPRWSSTAEHAEFSSSESGLFDFFGGTLERVSGKLLAFFNGIGVGALCGSAIGGTPGAIIGGISGGTYVLGAQLLHQDKMVKRAGTWPAAPMAEVFASAGPLGRWGIRMSNWNVLQCGPSSDKWENYCSLLLKGGTGVTAADVVAYQEVDAPNKAKGFDFIDPPEIVDDQYKSKNTTNPGSGWNIHYGTWDLGGGVLRNVYELETERRNRHLLFALHPKLRVEEKIIVSHPNMESEKEADDRPRPVFGLRVSWPLDPDDVSKGYDRAITIFNIHAENRGFDPTKYNLEILPLVAKIGGSRWAAVGDWNVELGEAVSPIPGPFSTRIIATANDAPTHLVKSGNDNRLDYMILQPGIDPVNETATRFESLGPTRDADRVIHTDKSDHFAVWNAILPNEFPP